LAAKTTRRSTAGANVQTLRRIGDGSGNQRNSGFARQLDAPRVAPENKEWWASRKDISREIDPQAIDVT
jgi:hypothetical protein